MIWVFFYGVQRLIGFVCTDDIIFFTWICLFLQYLQDIVFFLGELIYAVFVYFFYDLVLPVVCVYIGSGSYLLLVMAVDSAIMFYVEMFIMVSLVYLEYFFNLVIILVDQYLCSFDSVFFSLREFWPNSAGSRSFVLWYGWLIFLCLANRSVRDTVFGKPPVVPLIPRHMMDLYK